DEEERGGVRSEARRIADKSARGSHQAFLRRQSIRGENVFGVRQECRRIGGRTRLRAVQQTASLRACAIRLSGGGKVHRRAAIRSPNRRANEGLRFSSSDQQ